MLPRFKHILVPLDLTAKNKAALDIAFELAVENKARVSLLHVTQAIEPVDQAPDAETVAFYNRVQQRVTTELETLAQRFEAANLDVEVKVHLGQPLKDIVQFSETHKVDLIVMSSHPIDASDVINSWGTLSYKVSLACKCPILLVK